MVIAGGLELMKHCMYMVVIGQITKKLNTYACYATLWIASTTFFESIQGQCE